ncbi:MAG TPA: hypothetical protein VK054_12035, partial [Beutenbergiaceae bacterium]|nr:hypothetical protein [Beutenbergiaceae bacterium]
MALPTSKQPHKEHPPTWNSPFAPEWPHWNRNRIDMFGESIHTRHQANFQKLLSVVKRNRPVQRTEFDLRYARGHLRQKGQKLWLPYSESVEHTREHAFPEALPDD